MIKNYGAVLFDMDGVLIDSMSIHCRAFNECLSPFGLKVDQNDISGRSTLEILTKLLSQKLEAPAIHELCNIKSKLSLELLRSSGPDVLFPGVLSALQCLVDKFELALCSSGSRSSVEYVVDELLPRDLFSCVVHSGHVVKAKPHPEIFLMACRQLNLEPQKCVVVEDAVAGVQAGLSAGCDVFYKSEKLEDTAIFQGRVSCITSLDEVVRNLL